MSGACFVACAVGAVGAAWFVLTVPETLKKRTRGVSKVRPGRHVETEELMLLPTTEAGMEQSDTEQAASQTSAVKEIA
jgi:hypothetical protein